MKKIWIKTKQLFIKYVLPIGIIILTVLEIISLIKGGKGFEWIGKLKYGGKKKVMDVKYDQAMEKVKKNDEKITALKKKIEKNDGDISKHNDQIKHLEAQKSDFEKEVDNAKNDMDKLSELVRNNL